MALHGTASLGGPSSSASAGGGSGLGDPGPLLSPSGSSSSEPLVVSANGSGSVATCQYPANYPDCFNITVYGGSLLVVDFTWPGWPGGGVEIQPNSVYSTQADFNALYFVRIPHNSTYGAHPFKYRLNFWDDDVFGWVAFDVLSGQLIGTPTWTHGPTVPPCPATDCTWSWNATTPMSGYLDSIAVVLPSIYLSPILGDNCPSFSGTPAETLIRSSNCNTPWSGGVTVGAIYENVTSQYDGILTANMFAAQTQWEGYTTDYHGTEGFSFLLCGGQLNTVTFVESGLTPGARWSVDFGGVVQSSTTTTDVFTACQGSTSWSVPHVIGYHVNPSSGTALVQGSNATENLVFTPYDDVEVKALYVGDFISGASLPNVFGVYAANGSTPASSVSGVLDGTTYTFSQSASGTQTPWNLSLNMADVPSSGKFAITVNFSGQPSFLTKYSVTILSLPGWLQSLVSVSEEGGLSASGQAEWGNTFDYELNYALPLAVLLGFNMSIPLLSSGGYSWIPDFDLSFSFDSATNSATLTGDFNYTSPGLEFDDFVAPLTANLTVKLTMTGTVAVNPISSTFVWTQSTAELEFGVDFDIVIPIAGVAFSLFGQTYTLGLTFEIDVAPSYDVTFTFTPSGSGQGTFGGLDITVSPGAGEIDIPVTLTLKVGTDQIASLSGGGSLDFTFALESQSPYISSASVSGSLFIGGCLFDICAQDTWNVASTSFSPALFLPPARSASSVSYLVRYYNTSAYQNRTWTAGAFNGTAVEDVFPHAQFSTVAIGTTSYIAWGYDNVRLPESKSSALTGFSFSSSSRTLANLSLPNTTGTLASNPVLGPDGSDLVAFWDSIGYSSVNTTNPLNTTKLVLDEATYNPSAGTWSKTKKWLAWGDPVSTAVSRVGTDTRALVLVTRDLFAGSGQLVEYDVPNDTVLFNETVSNVVGVSSFNAPSNVAVLTLINGGAELWNVGTNAPVSIPSIPGADLEAASLVNTSVVGLWYQGTAVNEYVVYNLTNSTVFATVPLGANVSATDLVGTGGQLYLAMVGNDELSTVAVVPGGADVRVGGTYRVSDVTQLIAQPVSGDLILYAGQDSGNTSEPLLDLGVSVVPLAKPPTPKLTVSMAGADEIHLSWTDASVAAYGPTEFVVYSGPTARPTHLLYVASPSQFACNVTESDPFEFPMAFAVEAQNFFGDSAASKPVFVYSVVFDSSDTNFGNWTAKFDGFSEANIWQNHSFDAVNGSYSYSITPPSGSSAGLTKGTVTVAGYDTFGAESFAKSGTRFYALTVNESGLPKGGYWQVNVSALVQSSVSTSLKVYLPNGTYSYTIFAPGYAATPSNGSLTVKGVALQLSVTFTDPPAPIAVPRSRNP